MFKRVKRGPPHTRHSGARARLRAREPGISAWESPVSAKHFGIPGSRPASAGRAPEWRARTKVPEWRWEPNTPAFPLSSPRN